MSPILQGKKGGGRGLNKIVKNEEEKTSRRGKGEVSF